MVLRSGRVLSAESDGSPTAQQIDAAAAPASPKQKLQRGVTKVGKDQRILNAKADETSVWNAISSNNIERLKRMVRDDGDILRSRDAVGATPILLCCLLRRTDMVKWLLQHDPSQGCLQYNGAEYLGENCLHIAIVNKDIALAKHLLGLFPQLLHQRAIGEFFKKDAPLPGSLTVTPCYYGEYPCHFAAATNQPEILDLLVGVDPSILDLTDTNGNTVLHLCVEHERTDMYDHICAVDQQRVAGGHKSETLLQTPLQDVKNKGGRSTLLMAANAGSRVMLEHLLERSKIVQWSFGEPNLCIIEQSLVSLGECSSEHSTSTSVCLVVCASSAPVLVCASTSVCLVVCAHSGPFMSVGRSRDVLALSIERLRLDPGLQTR